MSWDNIRQEINTNIADNDHQLITAEKVRTTLIDIVSETENEDSEIILNIDTLYDNINRLDDKFGDYYTKTNVDAIEQTLVDGIGEANGRITDVENNLSENYYGKEHIDTLDNDIWSELDNLNNNFDNYYTKTEVDETCAIKKYVGFSYDTITLSNNYNFYCMDFMYRVEETRIKLYGQQPQNGLYVKCDLLLFGEQLTLDYPFGDFYKTSSNVIMRWNNILNKALELSGIDANEYIPTKTNVLFNSISFDPIGIIFMSGNYNLNCFSSVPITNGKLNTNVSLEFYLLKQNNN